MSVRETETTQIVTAMDHADNQSRASRIIKYCVYKCARLCVCMCSVFYKIFCEEMNACALLLHVVHTDPHHTLTRAHMINNTKNP